MNVKRYRDLVRFRQHVQMFSRSDFLTRKDVINVPGQLDGVDPREGLQDAGENWSTEQVVEGLEVSAPQCMVKDKMIQRQRRVTESMDQLLRYMDEYDQ